MQISIGAKRGPANRQPFPYARPTPKGHHGRRARVWRLLSGSPFPRTQPISSLGGPPTQHATRMTQAMERNVSGTWTPSRRTPRTDALHAQLATPIAPCLRPTLRALKDRFPVNHWPQPRMRLRPQQSIMFMHKIMGNEFVQKWCQLGFCQMHSSSFPIA